MGQNQHKIPMIVTIDGPGGSGKDTLADMLAKGIMAPPHKVLIANTGNFSRSIAAQVVSSGIQPEHPGFRDFAIQCMDTMDFFKIDPKNLFTAEVEKIISSIAAIPEIRDGFKIKMPQIIAAETTADIILILGRITGSVFPDAQAKLFLQTSPDICAHRRALSRSKNGEDYNTVLQALIERNKNDLVNWSSNFELPQDTVVIDTDHLTPHEVYQQAVSVKLHQSLVSWKNI